MFAVRDRIRAWCVDVRWWFIVATNRQIDRAVNAWLTKQKDRC